MIDPALLLWRLIKKIDNTCLIENTQTTTAKKTANKQEDVILAIPHLLIIEHFCFSSKPLAS